MAAALAVALTGPLAVVQSYAPAVAAVPLAPNELAQQLGADWSSSTDRALETSVDSAGYHLYVADGSSGFAWRPLATIRPNGMDSGAWTGYSCLTGTGDHVVSVVAPASFANSPLMRDRGAFAYVVDVASGAVHPVVSGVALKYYSPGCGEDDSAVLTRSLGTDQEGTQLITVNTARASISATVTLRGQITSSVPDGAGAIVGADGSQVVRIDRGGHRRVLASPGGQAYDIRAASGRVDFLAVAAVGQARAYEYASRATHEFAHGPVRSTRLFGGRRGRPALVGSVSVDAASHAAVIQNNLPGAVDGVSLDGQVVIGRAAGGGRMDLRSTTTGRVVTRSADLGPAATNGATSLPSLRFKVSENKVSAVPKVLAAAATPTCSVPRNSPTAMALQPSRAQVQRAVDLAVSGDLRDTRQANYMNMGLASYSASGDFGKRALVGGGAVPAQVYLGILAQESNLDQASWHALPGIAANPLIGDYYGAGGTVDQIDYSKADCGYGIGQVTTGMRAADSSPYSANGKRKIAVDYEENVAAGLQILSDKWNQLAGLGIIANDGSASYIENWYFAIWAYNTGIQPDAAHANTSGCSPSPSCTDSAGNWGLGWANNPINPDYPPGRDLFLRVTYADAQHPNSWPYQERVLGWIEYPQRDLQGDASYATPDYGSASPQNGGYRLNVPGKSGSYGQFCDIVANTCDPSDSAKTYCGYRDSSSPLYLHCWWHSPKKWVADCTSACAVQQLVYQPGSADPGVTDPHPADCQSKLPSSAVIVDEEASDINVAGCGSGNWQSSGSFGLSYGNDSSAIPLGVIDTHQLGAGFGGRLVFTHNVAVTDAAHKVTGTWSVSLPSHLYNVYVHTPSTGGTTDSAHYKILGTDGTKYERVISQHTNEDEWTGIGAFQLDSTAEVTLDNVTDDTSHNHDVAFDAIGFVPVSGTFKHRSFDAVSVIDPATNLDTNTPSQFDTPLRTRQTLYDWATERTSGGPQWDDPSKGNVRGLMQIPKCTGTTTSSCIGANTLAAASAWGSQVVAAGTATSGDLTEGAWMGFTNPRPNPSADPATAYASDLSYKLKTHVDVSYAVDGSGKVVPGSESSSVTSRVGSTQIMPFARAFMQAVARDYGVAAPNLAFNEVDAHTYTGDATAIGDPIQSGFTPARAYMPHASAATIDESGTCAQVKAITGGVDAYRPLDAEPQTDSKVHAWSDAVRQLVTAGRAPVEVADAAGDLYSLLFRAVGVAPPNGSLFNQAPPIWHNIAMKFCADGTVASTQVVPNKDDNPQRGLVYQGYMPDLYLYLDGKMVDNTGQPAEGPIQRGDFATFSNIPAPLSSDADNAYGSCDVQQRGNGGNPWNISVPPLSSPGELPHRVRYCDDGQIFEDGLTP